MKQRVVFVTAVALAAGLGTAIEAHADWTFTGASSANTTTGTVNITSMSGAYAANGGNLSGSGTTLNTDRSTGGAFGIGGFGSGAKWVTSTAATAYSATGAGLQFYSGGGLGMASDSTAGVVPNHALDNGPSTDSQDKVIGLGNTEALVLGFSSSVVLKNIGLGWASNGSQSSGSSKPEDLSVFRWTGSTSAALSAVQTSLTGTSLSSTAATTISNMATSGWELVGNYAALKISGTNAINSSNLGSSWWLISAYNTGFGSTATNGGSLTQGNDYFKVLSLVGSACTSQTAGQCSPATVPSVPEPGSLALVTLALGGAWSVRRRRPGSGGMALAAA